MIIMMQKRSFLHASREGNGGMPENEDSRKVERGERTKETERSSLAKGGGAGKRCKREMDNECEHEGVRFGARKVWGKGCFVG